VELPVIEGEAFRSLIRQVRAGDQQAATILVREYEPEIRRMVRLRLTDPRQRRLIDSVDICQSVLANFFVRAAAGQFDIDSPQQHLHLLATMAKNRLLNHVQQSNAQRRDSRRETANDEALAAVAANEPTPSWFVSGAELLERARAAMTESERRIYDLRAANHNWTEIAAVVGGSAESVRKRHQRLIDRLGQMLVLDETRLT
jgi:RNA polymerase sigma-70 factor (ECF subfamily)